MNGLILHCGGQEATYEELGKIELPEKTKSYCPVGHQYVIERAKERFQEALNLEIKSEAYGVNKEGRQMFGVLAFEGKDGSWGPSLRLRNSYDKSLPIGVAMGARVFVCDNLCFDGNSFTVLRRHTSQVLEDLDGLFEQASQKARGQFDQLSDNLTRFQEIEMEKEDGFANLGILFGRKAITSTVFNEAARYWDHPVHEEHADGNVYNWYQAVNYGLKKVAPRQALESYAQLHVRANELAEG